MSIVQHYQRSAPHGAKWPALRGGAIVGLACGLALSLPIPTPAQADIIRSADSMRGFTVTQAQCAARPDTVWVVALGRPFCVRYYLSTAGGEGRRPVVFLAGDKFGRLDLRTRSFFEAAKIKDIDTAHLARLAEALSKTARTTAIYVGRIGVDGTSGHHSARKTRLELYLMNAALDAIKQRHRFEGFHLAGQSGGATLVSGLIAMRNDIACAVPGAAQLFRRKSTRPAPHPSLDYFDPMQGIPAIARNRSLRLLVVTDPADKQVSGPSQTAFVEQLRTAGGKVEQFLVEATDEKHHFVSLYTRLVVSECARGTLDQAIAGKLAAYVAKRVAAAKAKKEQEGDQADARPGRTSMPQQSAPRPPAPQNAAPQQPAPEGRAAPSSEMPRPEGRTVRRVY